MFETRLRLENDTSVYHLPSLERPWAGPSLPIGTTVGLLAHADHDMVFATVVGYDIPDICSPVLYIDLEIGMNYLATMIELGDRAGAWFLAQGWTESRK